ncbi:MAG: hypothetical protein HPY89_06190 [Pelotomaculum sp.]|uniref:Uncharacterized protein n=1 Tax=Pelotomaculum thermopropionicum (strain DSM 13744 / JCM 10971 / SI) TaxID=370438 RepID=A5D3P0_PELTS|nr:hypothetical protein [Pelotomaculum sp.]BAF59145.1 hypothetical protein PTH_0964 [Pelotomaculum thermopropionicum SI]
MSLFSGLLEHRGSDLLAREQISFFVRDAQNSMMEMGKLLQQIADAAHPDISQQCSRLLQLNAQVGNTLEYIQKSLK